MLVVKEIDKNQIHTFAMPKVKKNSKGGYDQVEVDGQPVLEEQTFYETGETVNGLPVVARALGKNDTHVILYVRDDAKQETK